MFYLPVLVLFALSAAAYILALREHSAAWRLLAITVVSAGAFFWVDVAFDRFQVSVCIATHEYWDSGGRAQYYFAWWWFNDRWLID